MCLLLLKLLPLFTGSVLWVEGLPLVISGDDLPMERALYNKHKAVDGQEVTQIALGDSVVRGSSGERQQQEFENSGLSPHSTFSKLRTACTGF